MNWDNLFFFILLDYVSWFYWLSVAVPSIIFILLCSYFFFSPLPCYIDFLSLHLSLFFFLVTLFTSLHWCCFVVDIAATHSVTHSVEPICILLHCAHFIFHPVTSLVWLLWSCFHDILCSLKNNLFSFTHFAPAASLDFTVTVVVAAGSRAIKLVHSVNFNGEILHKPFVYITSTLTKHALLGLQGFPN